MDPTVCPNVDVSEAQDRTSLITILSSAHGRQRRRERHIAMHDLQAAVKYGKKEMAKSHPKTGELRWKYTFADVVFITDEASRREITSWPLPGCGLYVPQVALNPRLVSDHERDYARIRADPSHWTSHTVIVVDQSGSMRKMDANDGSTRSDAVWVTLACMWVSEQLASGQAQATDVVSIIGMNAQSTLLIDRHPMNWVLFNKIVHFITTSAPESDGNYNPALTLAEKCLLTNAMGSCALLLLFLSDGKPSDHAPSGNTVDRGAKVSSMIGNTIGKLASRFGRRLTVGTIGFGPPDETFVVLRHMADIACTYGSNGSFQAPTLSAQALKLSLTLLSSTLTNTKTEMSVLGGNTQRTVRDVMRVPLPQIVSTNDEYVDSTWITYSDWYVIERAMWSCENQNWEVKNSRDKFVSPLAIGVAARKSIFGEGAERMVRQFREYDASSKFIGPKMVAKESRFLEDLNSSNLKKFHEVFCDTQQRAEKIAVEFNKRLAVIPGLSDTTPRIVFLPCSVYVVDDNLLGTSGWLVEQMLEPSAYTKFNGNNGYVEGGASTIFEPVVAMGPAHVVQKPLADIAEESDEDGSASDDSDEVPFSRPPLQSFSVSATDIPQAFSHFTYRFSKRKMLVCDLQGVLNRSCTPPIYQLTDPVIHYKSSKGRTNVYGRTDRGHHGVNQFFSTHKCSELCGVLNREFMHKGRAKKKDRIER
jgi:hypothetical protein